jgi:hypothetical protein
MKKWFLAVAVAIGISAPAMADYRLIVPQDAGQGTDVWARIVAREWEKKLGEKIIIENIPGANDVPGFNKFHNSLRKDPKTIMVAHGGNAESFLYQKVDYNYADYAPIGLQNLTIMVGRRADSDPYAGKVRFGAASGTNPDMLAITMLICGPGKTLQQYGECFKEKVKYVPGMSGSERKLAYMRGELNATRETPAAYLKVMRPIPENVDWFNPGILDLNTGKLVDDPNFPGILFADVFKQRWGSTPSGDLYQAWLLDKSYRDVLQKAMFVDKGNPNIEKLRSSLKATLDDPESRAAIEKETGKYGWIIGDDVHTAIKSLESQLTQKALKDLVWFIKEVFGQDAIYKEEIARKAK